MSSALMAHFLKKTINILANLLVSSLATKRIEK